MACVKKQAVFGFGDDICLGDNQFHIVFGQYTFTIQIQRTVQCRLNTHDGQNGIRALFGDDLFKGLPVYRLDVGGIGHRRIGHDRGRIRIHENDAIAFLAQRLASLRAGIIELAGLTYHNRARTEDEDTVYVGSFWHIQTVGLEAAKALSLRRLV